MLNKFKDNMKKDIENFNKKSNDYLDIFDNKISKLKDKISKIKDTIKNNKALTNPEKIQLTNQQDSINNEHRRAVNRIQYLKKEMKNHMKNYMKMLKNFLILKKKK